MASKPKQRQKSKKKYGIRSGYRIKGNPQKIGEEFEDLRKKYGKGLKWDIVVREARKKTSPLHKEFTWALRKAAEKCWKREAMYLIQAITVFVYTVNTPKPQQIEVRDNIGIIDKYDEPYGEVTYYSRDTVFSSKRLRKKALKSAVLHLKTGYDKYHDLTELDHVWALVAQLNLKDLLDQL